MHLRNVRKRDTRQSPRDHLASGGDRACIVSQACSSLLTTVQRTQRRLAARGCSEYRGAAFNQIEVFRRLPRCTENRAGRPFHALHRSNQPRQCKAIKARDERITRQYIHRN